MKLHTGMSDHDPEVVNSATKYPSIPTYHPLGSGKRLVEREPVRFVGPVLLDEKIDGANGRGVIFPNGDFFLGSRERWVYTSTEKADHSTDGLVEELLPVIERIRPVDDTVLVLYLEFYGGQVTRASRNYTGKRTFGHRLFDAAQVPLDVLSWSRAKASSWRKNGGQAFMHRSEVIELAARENLPMVPNLGTIDGSDLPTTIEETHHFLIANLPRTRAGLDEGGEGVPEGVILRTPGRETVAKVRYENYWRSRGIRQGTPVH